MTSQHHTASRQQTHGRNLLFTAPEPKTLTTANAHCLRRPRDDTSLPFPAKAVLSFHPVV